MRLLLLSLLLLTVTSLRADIEIGAGPLLLKGNPNIRTLLINDDRPFISRADQKRALPSGIAQGPTSEYNVGVEVTLSLLWCDCKDITLEVRSLHPTLPREQWPAQVGFWPTLGLPKLQAQELFGPGSLASSCGHFYFDSLNVDVGSRSASADKLTLRAALGLHLYHLKEELEVHYRGLVNKSGTALDRHDADLHSKTLRFGIGPALSVQMRYDLFKRLYATAALRCALLAGNQRGSFSDELITTLISSQGVERHIVQLASAHYRSTHRLTPLFEERLGLGAAFALCQRLCLTLEAGYLWLSYVGAGTSYCCRSLNFDGFYFKTLLLF